MFEKRIRILGGKVCAAVILFGALSTVAAAGGLSQYKVTLENLSSGQPLSPPVAATHRHSIIMVGVGKLVSGEAEILAEEGDQGPLVDWFSWQPCVTEVVDVGVPLLPMSTASASDAHRVAFQIGAQPGDRLSLAAMLVCTNDGLTAVDRLKLRQGGRTYRLLGFDAGTEDNTESSFDLPDACSSLGPAPLAGDPNGNENTSVDTTPHVPVALHPGLDLIGDLLPVHTWSGPVARMTVVRLGESCTKHYSTQLSSFAESPPTDTDARGNVSLKVKNTHRAHLRLRAHHIDGATAAHIRLGEPGTNGPVVVTIWSAETDPGSVPDPNPGDPQVHPGLDIRITLQERDLDGGPFEGDFAAFISAMNEAALYVEVESTTYPEGEIRGQIGADN